MTIVYPNTLYFSPKGHKHFGFYLDENMKYNFDNFIIRGVAKNFDAVILITGLEGCVDGSTLISTPKGLVAIKDMDELSDIHVWDWKEKKQKVSFARMVCSGKKECYEVTFDDDTTFICTLDHKMFISPEEEMPLSGLHASSIVLCNKGYEGYKVIRSKRFIGKRMTYDLQVPNYNNFIIDNGLILRNSGKSTFTQALGHYCDPILSVNDVVFDGSDLMRRIDTCPPGKALIFDEAIMNLQSQDSGNEMQKVLIKKFTLIRKKRLIIFLVIPSIFMLRRYFAIFRTRCMINCYCPDGLTRGYYRFYSFSAKKNVYLNGFKEMNMGASQPDFKGRFTDTYGWFVNAYAYENKKDEAIKKLTVDKNSKEDQLRNYIMDYKLKLQLDFARYKTKMNEKVIENKDRSLEELNKLRDSFKLQMTDMKTEGKSVQRAIDKKRIEEMELEKTRLLAFLYDKVSENYKVNMVGEELTYAGFAFLLKDQKIIDLTLPKIKSYVETGRNYLRIEQDSEARLSELTQPKSRSQSQNKSQSQNRSQSIQPATPMVITAENDPLIPKKLTQRDKNTMRLKDAMKSM